MRARVLRAVPADPGFVGQWHFCTDSFQGLRSKGSALVLKDKDEAAMYVGGKDGHIEFLAWQQRAVL